MSIKYNFTLLLSLFFAFTVAAQTKNDLSNNVQIDTITVFDPVTKTETITIVKTLNDKVIESGDIAIRMDTVQTFDDLDPNISTVYVVKYYTDKITGKERSVKKSYGLGSKLVEVIDTVITFYPETYEERIEVIKSFEIQGGKSDR